MGFFVFGCVVFFTSLFSGVGLVKLGPPIQVSLDGLSPLSVGS